MRIQNSCEVMPPLVSQWVSALAMSSCSPMASEIYKRGSGALICHTSFIPFYMTFSRYANMDYIVGSMLRHIHPRLRKIFSYDIVCQWWKLLKERLALLPPLV